MLPRRRAFKISVAHYANDRRYRRAQSAYLVLLLLLAVAMWPSVDHARGPDEPPLVEFLTAWLIPLGFALTQARLGLGLRDTSEEEPPEHLPVPTLGGVGLAVCVAELLHLAALWALQSPLVIAVLAAGGLTTGETLLYLLRLLGYGAGARLAGLLGRGLFRRGSSVIYAGDPENTYSRSSATVSK